MTYPKIPQTISDPVNDNIQKLAALFPSAVKDGELDIDALKQELGEFTEAGPEKYDLTWAGKQQARQIAFEPIVGKTLQFVPEDSKQPDTTENLFIEGDNLEVLKLLRQNYYGAVKLICIDPPYNTGHDFIYNDNFKMSRDESDMAQGDMSDLGERYTRNRKDHNRYHANWLNMMYPRLRVAKDLLRDDGVIFICIDDGEVDNLRKICDEIFGENNFIDTIIWKKRYGGGAKEKYLITLHEYVLMYVKNISVLDNIYVPLTEKSIKRYYKLTDNNSKVRGPYRTHPLEATKSMGERKNLVFDIPAPDGTMVSPKRQWLWEKERVKKALEKNELEFIKGRNGDWSVHTKQYLKDEDGTIRKGKAFSIIDDIYTQHGTNETINLFGHAQYFSFPKPSKFIQRLLEVGLGESKVDIVLDFFAGSATAAHATTQLNAEDGGNRKYIMVQLPEPCDETSEAFKAKYKNICDIGKERIRRAGDKILEDNKDKDGIENLDIGFKVFRVADTNINWLHQDLKGYDLFDHYDKNASDKDKLDFMPGFTDLDVVYEIMLRQTDIPLSSKVIQLSDIGQRTYMFADSFVVCLEQDITRDLVNRLAAIEPLPVKFVFRDSAFDDNIALKDETFRRLNALIEKNSGGENPAYIVEFI